MMIQSGHTVSAANQLARWYNAEYQNAKNDTYGLWELNERGLERLLDTRTKVPFRDFMIRYLLFIHAGDLMKEFREADEKEIFRWVGGKAKEIVCAAAGQIADSDDQKKDNGAKLLDQIVNLVFRDFQQNRYCGSGKKQEKVYGSLSINKAVKWTKEDLREKITADTVRDSEMYGFAFGLNMTYEDLDFFLKKAFFRPGFDLWKPEDFILYITFKYAEGDKYAFWRSITAAYEEIKKEKKPGEKPEWMSKKNFSTDTIRCQVDALVEEVKKRSLVFSLDLENNLPQEVTDFLREYYALVGAQGSYTRTSIREMKKLLGVIEENLKEEIEAANNAAREPLHAAIGPDLLNPNLAQGKVRVYYNLKDGLYIPEGTPFIKRSGGKEVRFITRKEVKVIPSASKEKPLVSVELKVISVDTERKTKSKEEMRLFIKKHSDFFCDDTNLCEMKNGSGFKGQEKDETIIIDDSDPENLKTKAVTTPFKNIPEGDPVHTGGTITALCREGHTIKAGTRFWTKNSKDEKVFFRLVKTVKAETFMDLFVFCTEEGEVAEKNTITECSLDKEITKITKITNSKIGFKQKADGVGQDGGPLCNYLYSEIAADWTFTDVLHETYLDKLGAVLEGTRITPAKISHIRNGKKETITRSDLLTFSFLAYASVLRKIRLDSGDAYEKDYGHADLNNPEEKSRYSGFFQQTNKCLVKCGYYELYQPNPYDALLIYLMSHNEAIDALRNLWSWYLGKKKLKEKKQA